MSRKPDSIIQYHQETVERIFESKRQFHRQQAQLPIEEKIRILVELQKIALNIRKTAGQGDQRRIWEL